MKKFFNFKKKIPSIVFLVIFVFLVTVFTCMFHISNIRNSIGREVAKQYESQIVVGGKGVYDRVENVCSSIKDARNEIAQKIESNYSAAQIIQVLMKYTNIKDVYDVSYISIDGMYYKADGTMVESDSRFEGILTIKESCMYIANNYAKETDYMLLHVEPVYVDNKIEGYVVGVQNIDMILNSEAFSNIERIGDLFIIKRDGSILGVDYRSAQLNKSNKYENIHEYLGKEILFTKDSLNDVKNARANVGINGMTLQCMSLDRKPYYVSLTNIPGINDMILVAVYNSDKIGIESSKIVTSTIIAVAIVLLAMTLLLVIQVIVNGRNSRMISELAYNDDITGGKNINYFREFATKTLKAFPGMPFSIHRFDISNFRYINETYGHEKADRLLKAIVEEGTQIFNTKELIVRMNADQFVMLTRNTLDLEERIVQLVDLVNARSLDIGIRYPIKLKRGVYTIHDVKENIDIMIDKANAARKELTGDEKDPVVTYSDKLINEMRKVDKIESEMEVALFNHEFKMFVQPKWNIKEDCLYGGEALVRWIKEDGSMVYPSDFVPIFEKNGFVEQLDMFMLESACKMIRGLMNEGKKVYPISVNQSRVLLHNPKYIERITDILRRYNIPQGSIELEITETVFFMEKDKMFAVLNNLKSRDVAISMDDFGSGYSSLNMLKDFPFDVLKIDREFFSESITSESSVWILKKIVEMAHGLGIRVICEGVETQEQIDMLKDIGVHYVQGYFYSKPIPYEKFVEEYCLEHAEYSEEQMKEYDNTESMKVEEEKKMVEAAIKAYAERQAKLQADVLNKDNEEDEGELPETAGEDS